MKRISVIGTAVPFLLYRSYRAGLRAEGRSQRRRKTCAGATSEASAAATRGATAACATGPAISTGATAARAADPPSRASAAAAASPAIAACTAAAHTTDTASAATTRPADPAPRPAQQQHTQQAQQSRSGQQQRPERSVAQQQRQRSMPALRLSARGSGRIPDDRFRANFGVGHRFVIREPVMVGGYSRFQYGGFWFGFDEAWPVEWYYTDDVYVDYIDGEYFLYNPYYPGSRVMISVVL